MATINEPQVFLREKVGLNLEKKVSFGLNEDLNFLAKPENSDLEQSEFNY